MIYPVLITSAARCDLEEIHIWIAEHDSPEKADYVLDRLSEAAKSIAELPQRGSRPRNYLVKWKLSIARSFSSHIA